MRAIIQRVNYAKLYLKNELFSEIGNGLLIYIGFHINDNEELIQNVSSKLCNIKIFEDEKGHLGYSLKDTMNEIMLVSNFTLYANTNKNRMSFLEALKPELASSLYNQLIETIESILKTKVKSGKFGDYMTIESKNDGPVNVLFEI